MWKYYNPNPVARSGNDCSVRAISKALGLTWEQAFVRIALNGFLMGDVMATDSTWGSLLRQHGYHKYIIPNTCPDCYTAEAFCEDHPDGTYVLGFGGHVATCVDGVLYDSWDSSSEIPVYYWTNKHEDNDQKG